MRASESDTHTRILSTLLQDDVCQHAIEQAVVGVVGVVVAAAAAAVVVVELGEHLQAQHVQEEQL